MYKETIISFTRLLKEQPNLFTSEEQWSGLHQLLDLTGKNLSNTIIEWCEKYPKIDSLLDLDITSEQRGAGGTGGEPPSLEELETLLKQEIINTIRVPSPSNKPSEPK